MASFDPEESRPQSNTSDTGIVKYPMKRLELSIRNFIKVLDIDLDRLHRHTENIKKVRLRMVLRFFYSCNCILFFKNFLLQKYWTSRTLNNVLKLCLDVKRILKHIL